MSPLSSNPPPSPYLALRHSILSRSTRITMTAMRMTIAISMKRSARRLRRVSWVGGDSGGGGGEFAFGHALPGGSQRLV